MLQTRSMDVPMRTLVPICLFLLPTIAVAQFDCCCSNGPMVAAVRVVARPAGTAGRRLPTSTRMARWRSSGERAPRRRPEHQRRWCRLARRQQWVYSESGRQSRLRISIPASPGLETAVGRGGNQLTLYSASGATLWTRSPFAGGAGPQPCGGGYRWQRRPGNRGRDALPAAAPCRSASMRT